MFVLLFALDAPFAAPETLRYYDELPSTLNPLYATSLADVRAQSLVYDPLFSQSVIS